MKKWQKVILSGIVVEVIAGMVLLGIMYLPDMFEGNGNHTMDYVEDDMDYEDDDTSEKDLEYDTCEIKQTKIIQSVKVTIHGATWNHPDGDGSYYCSDLFIGVMIGSVNDYSPTDENDQSYDIKWETILNTNKIENICISLFDENKYSNDLIGKFTTDSGNITERTYKGSDWGVTYSVNYIYG